MTPMIPMAPMTPPPAPDTHRVPSFVRHVETVNGRAIGRYIDGLTGRRIYTVGRVGFYFLDEARTYARIGS